MRRHRDVPLHLLAIIFNQPYGPVLVAALLVIRSGRSIIRGGA